MSDEFDHNPDNNYSAFWPLLILVGGLFVWFGVQDYMLNNQRSAYDRQFHDQQFLTVVSQAENVSKKYVALMKDLVETSAKDPAAAQIVKDAIKANLIHVQAPASTNGTANPAAPTSTPSTPTK